MCDPVRFSFTNLFQCSDANLRLCICVVDLVSLDEHCARWNDCAQQTCQASFCGVASVAAGNSSATAGVATHTSEYMIFQLCQLVSCRPRCARPRVRGRTCPTYQCSVTRTYAYFGVEACVSVRTRVSVKPMFLHSHPKKSKDAVDLRPRPSQLRIITRFLRSKAKDARTKFNKFHYSPLPIYN